MSLLVIFAPGSSRFYDLILFFFWGGVGGVKHVVLHIVSDVGSEDVGNLLYLEGQLDKSCWWRLESDLCSDLCQFLWVYRIFSGIMWDHMATTNPQKLTWKLKID